MKRDRKLVSSACLLSIGVAMANTAGAQVTEPASGSNIETPQKKEAPTTSVGIDTSNKNNTDQLEEVVVTAERRATTVQEAPLSVTAISGADLETTGVNSYRDALKNAPSVVVEGTSQTDTTAPTIAIRGLGTDGGGRTGAVAVYVDGVIVNNANLQFYDLSRVEVVAGPQATLYGGVATGGAVNIISNNPSFNRASGEVRLGGGNFDELSFEGMANLPLSDKFAVRAAVNADRRANYWGGQGDGRDEINGRFKALYKPNDNLSILLGAEVYRFTGAVEDGLAPEDAQGHPAATIPTIGYGNINDNKLYANITANLGFANLTYIPALQIGSTNITSQVVPYLDGRFTSFNNTSPYEDQVTQELRFSNKDDSPVKWVGGLYFQHAWMKKTNTTSPLEQDVAPPTFTPPYPVVVTGGGDLPVSNDPSPTIYFQTIDITQYHPFAQVTVPVLPGIRLTGGVSYSSYEINYPQTQTFGGATPASYVYDTTFHNVDGVGRIEGDLSAKNLVYASFSTGFRPGGPGSGQAGQEYGKETVKAYEIGSKNRFLNDRLQVNADAYYDKFPGFQNQINSLDQTGAPLQEIAVVPARLIGIELSLDAKLTSDDTLSLKTAWEKANYTANYINSAGVAVPTDGAQLTHAPKWDLNGDYNHEFLFTDNSLLVFDISAHYQSSQPVTFSACTFSQIYCADPVNRPGDRFTDDKPEYTAQYFQKGYVVADSSITYTLPNDKYSITAFGRNITNQVYKTNTTFGLANIGTPRTYGLLLHAAF